MSGGEEPEAVVQLAGPTTRVRRVVARTTRTIPALAAAAFVLSACSLSPFQSAPSGPISALPVNQGAAQATISQYRRAHGLSNVALDPALQKAAQQQALAMAKANELSHEVDGTLPRRLARNGLDPGAAIENVSAGYSSLASAIQSWKDSPEHDKNLLNTRMRRMGIAEAAAPKTRFKTFWSVIMTD